MLVPHILTLRCAVAIMWERFSFGLQTAGNRRHHSFGASSIDLSLGRLNRGMALCSGVRGGFTSACLCGDMRSSTRPASMRILSISPLIRMLFTTQIGTERAERLTLSELDSKGQYLIRQGCRGVNLRLVRTCTTTGQITVKHDLLRVARDIYCTTRRRVYTNSTRRGCF